VIGWEKERLRLRIMGSGAGRGNRDEVMRSEAGKTSRDVRARSASRVCAVRHDSADRKAREKRVLLLVGVATIESMFASTEDACDVRVEMRAERERAGVRRDDGKQRERQLLRGV
jgi:hypothetical protein